MKFSEWVLSQREKQGLSQADAANLLGVVQSRVSMWEKGHSDPSPAVLGKIFKAYGVDSAEMTALFDSLTDTAADPSGD
jgi:transcriptional regulator with XRE-family HTH domain